MPSKIHRPYMRHLPSVQSSIHRKVGRGSVLLLGGVGGASSYSSPDDYMETTGRQLGKGLGLGMSSLSKKLESLNIAPKKEKAKNIRFNL